MKLKNLALTIVLITSIAPAHADLSEGQAAIVGIAIGAALANNQVQIQTPVYVAPQVYYQQPYRMHQYAPQPFVYGTLPERRYHRHDGRSITYQTPSSTVTIIQHR